MIFRVALLILLSASPQGYGAVYHWIDTDGAAVFSDHPPPRPDIQRQRIVVPAPRTTPAIGQPDSDDRAASPSAASAPYEQFEIQGPADGSLIRNNSGDVPVRLQVTPPLQPGHHIALYLNGDRVAIDAATRFIVHNVDRGKHILEATILAGPDGQTLARTAPRTFTIQRFSMLHKRASPRSRRTLPRPRARPPITAPR